MAVTNYAKIFLQCQVQKSKKCVSFEIVARAFRNAQLRMDSLASLFGEVHFGRTTQLIMGAIEGGMFGCMMMAGMKVAVRKVFEKG